MSTEGNTTTEPRSASSRRKYLQYGLGLAVTLVCLYFAFRGVPLAEVGNAFRRAEYGWLLPMWVLLFVFYWLKAIRWSYLLRPLGRFSTYELFRPIMIGFAFNNVLPAHLGEFVRVFVFARKHQQPKSAVLSSVVLERLFDIVAILAFFCIGLFSVQGLPSTVTTSAYVFAAASIGGIVAAFIYVLFPKPIVALIESALRRLPLIPDRLTDKLCELLELGMQGLASIKDGRLLAGTVVTSLLQWAINGLLMYLSLRAFGVTVTPVAGCLLLGVTAFGVTVPASPGYFGVIQLCFVTVMSLYDANEADVLGASIYFQLFQYVPVTLLGMYYFSQTGLSVSEVESQKQVEKK